MVDYAVWYELLPYARLSAEVMGALRDRRIGIYLAVTPDVVDDLADTVKLCRDHGVRVGVWPMVERAHGRWPSAHNVDRFEAFIDEVMAKIDRADELIFDFEPPIDAMPALFRADLRVVAQYVARGIPRSAVVRFAALAERFNAQGIETVSAAMPLIASDAREGGWQSFFGTPLDTTPTRRVSAMLYTSIIEGLLPKPFVRRDVLALLSAGARALKRRYGDRASISLGAIDTGALGDEPTYRRIDELIEDVAITRAAGIEHIALFSLCGAMRNPPVERWLDALVQTEPGQVPEMTPGAAALMAAVWSASRLMQAGHRIFHR